MESNLLEIANFINSMTNKIIILIVILLIIGIIYIRKNHDVIEYETKKKIISLSFGSLSILTVIKFMLFQLINTF